eukprot:TRINITY_DN10034_c0_g1_i2.p1 TRINITY_DN10034_c0_g1~~TRINITY_DN10034_c0_g1_i2.p1  ORF type:complete len:296 (+),score=57.71 TRINITY_DN10034_c0_g1_i2:78-965(+)
MSADRGNTYSAPDPCSESLEKMTKRLTSDLRARVRRLAHFTPLSVEWIEMTDTLQHLASVAMMEEKDSAKKDGSIWERDELCVRYIIEEGKINMLLRTMNEFKVFQYTAMKEGSAKDEESRIRMKIFEQSLGIVLKCTFTAVEALQTLDLTHLIEHIAVVLKHSLEFFEPVPGELTVQEILVIQYLDLLLKKVENLNEENVMKQIESHEIVSLVLKHFEKFSPKLEKEAFDPYAYFLAHLMETEAYQTHRGSYIVDKDDKMRLALLEGRTKELMAADGDNRKALRALSDNIIRFK